jgi:signal transduction histidine kinase
MLTYASGAAFIDRTGAIIQADPGFLEALGLDGQDPSGALRARAGESSPLRALLDGRGPAQVRLNLGGGEIELSRHSATGGALLLVTTSRLQDRLEHAHRSSALSQVVAGVVHDVKNALNAMALQLAILSEKLPAAGEAAAVASPHLGVLREQIGRANDVVSRLQEVADPAAPLGHTDLGALFADVAALFAHEARRRRIHLAPEAARGVARAAGEPVRVGRMLLTMVAAAMAATPDGGRVEASVESADGRAVFRLVHAVGDGELETEYDSGVSAAAARALGGSLVEQTEGGVRRVELRLPGIERV